MRDSWHTKIIILAIISSGLVFRLFNSMWDQGTYLHPDERFLIMVSVALQVPESFASYFDPAVSTFNPGNVGYPFYVYGSFPVYAAKLISMYFQLDSYGTLATVGRTMSAVVDILTVFLVYAISKLITKSFLRNTNNGHEKVLFAIVTTALISWNAFAIQQAHFFTVDTFLTFFTTLTIFLFLRLPISPSKMIPVGITLAFGLASKVSILFIIPFIGMFYFVDHLFSQNNTGQITHRIVRSGGATFISLCILLASCYITYRVLQPFYFADNNIFNIRLNTQTLQSFNQLLSMDTPDTTFPPAVQWQTKPSIYWPFTQLFFIGLTPLTTVFSFFGVFSILLSFISAMYKSIHQKNLLLLRDRYYEYRPILFLALVSICYFLYQGSRLTMNMRYFYPIYPAFICCAVFFLIFYIKKPLIRNVLLTAMVGSTLMWAFAFTNIYTRPHSRVTASAWIYSNIPYGSKLAFEHWDDPLPLNIANFSNSVYTYEELPVFTPDSLDKWNVITEKLLLSDYYILSSNRAWGSMPTYPKRYPQSTVFYNKLFSEQLGMKKIAEFTSRPNIGTLEFNDDNTEESFTVYDHPKVLIYRITDKEKLRRSLQEL